MKYYIKIINQDNEKIKELNERLKDFKIWSSISQKQNKSGIYEHIEIEFFPIEKNNFKEFSDILKLIVEIGVIE